jgi:hypothetical protein
MGISMDTENTLLLFDEEHSCWTEVMVGLIGQDPGTLNVLLEKKLLEKEGEVYFLTHNGTERCRQVAKEFFLPSRPCPPGAATDKRRVAKRSLLQLLLDKRHLQRWGLKEYRKPFRFELPDLSRGELFSLSGRNLTWRYAENPVFVNMVRDFPLAGLAARKELPPAPERLAAWAAENMPKKRIMEADLLYKSRYDFQAYAQFPELPGDPCGLLNTDRFLCFFGVPPEPENENALLTLLGEFHMFLTMLRRMYLPGYVDLDSLDQDGINWLLYVYEREDEASRCAELLAPLGRGLAGPAAPLEIWSLSFEALWKWDKPAESIHDLLPESAHPILRVE